jgi:microcystin-dependent protein
MASTYSTSLKIQLMGNGEDSGTWGSITNTNWNLIEQAVSGVQTITMANANYTLTDLNGVSDEARNMVIVATGTNSGIRQIIAPLVPKFYVVTNSTVGGYAITIGGSSGSVITVPNATTVQVYCDGTNFYSAQTSSAGNFNVNGNLTVTGSSNIIPAGVIQMWAAAAAPSGFLLCNGTAVSRTTYATLFAVIGTTFGAGDGSTTFNLPNYVNKFPYGGTLGTTGGTADAIVVSHSHSASSGLQSADHQHFGTTGGQSADHNHGFAVGRYFEPAYGAGEGIGLGNYPVNTSAAVTTGSVTGATSNDHNHNFSTGGVSANHNHTITVDAAGSSGTNANLPPYLGINFIIKT